MTYKTFCGIISQVHFKDWEFKTGIIGRLPGKVPFGAGYYVQVRFSAQDVPRTHPSSPPIVEWSGRKWFVSHHSTESEVVQTCLKAVLTALEHEAREQFSYQGVHLFDPHIDVRAHMATAENRSFRP